MVFSERSVQLSSYSHQYTDHRDLKTPKNHTTLFQGKHEGFLFFQVDAEWFFEWQPEITTAPKAIGAKHKPLAFGKARET